MHHSDRCLVLAKSLFASLWRLIPETVFQAEQSGLLQYSLSCSKAFRSPPLLVAGILLLSEDEGDSLFCCLTHLSVLTVWEDTVKRLISNLRPLLSLNSLQWVRHIAREPKSLESFTHLISIDDLLK